MSLVEIFLGSLLEALSLVLMMNLFNRNYLRRPLFSIIVIIAVSVVTVATDRFAIPVGYLVNYITFIVLLSRLMKVRLINVFFEFLFSLAVIAALQLLLIFLNSRLVDADSLTMAERIVQLSVLIAFCAFLGTNQAVYLQVHKFYSKYYTQMYLVTGNLFVFSMAELYHWDTNGMLIEETGMLTIFVALWFVINAYLLKTLIDKQKEMDKNGIHEKYIEMTKILLDSLYAEKHEYRKHLQTIGGLAKTADPQIALKEIEGYITMLAGKENMQTTQLAQFHTGDSIVDALLYAKGGEAQKKEIGFFFVPEGPFPSFPCEKYELTEIIGNLIDNAFEYVSTLPKEERKVFLTISEQEGKRSIEVTNRYYAQSSKLIHEMSKKGYSTKGKEGRGYGLYHVKSIAAKHGGRFQIYVQDNQLAVNVLF